MDSSYVIKNVLKDVMHDYLMEHGSFIISHEEFDVAIVHFGTAYEYHANVNLSSEKEKILTFDKDIFLGTDMDLYSNYGHERFRSLWRKIKNRFWKKTASQRKIIKQKMNQKFCKKFLYLTKCRDASSNILFFFLYKVKNHYLVF